MDVHLIGGGWDDALAATLYEPFIEAAARRAGGTPRILLVVMGTDAESLDYHEKYVHTLGLVGGHELVVERISEGTPFDEATLDGIDGLFVGGGPTPEYHASLAGAYVRIRALVSGGMPYAGFSAGAAIAGSHAVIGGWRLDGAQWGNLSRLIAVVAAGLAPSGVAIDEGTRLGSDGAVTGAGRVWHVTPDRAGPGGACVRARTAGQ